MTTPYVDESITCPSSITDADGNAYPVVKIGNQCWIAENLKATKFKDGSSISYLTDAQDWSNTNNSAFTYYDNDFANKDIYGNLYNWNALTDTRGLCPDGWRLAAAEDWDELKAFAKISTGFEGSVKSTSLWNAPNPAASNFGNFNALPSGIRNEDGSFNGVNSSAYYFTPYEESSTEARTYNLWANADFLNAQTHDKKKGTACRCVME